MDKKTRLLKERERRELDVAEYQFNIDLYEGYLNEAALRSTPDKAALSAFVDDLHQRIAAERLEQLKSTVMLAAVQQQLAKLPVDEAPK